MDISFLPNIKSKSTKELVIKILSLKKSLTNKGIHSIITKKFGVSVTYQAIRQALMELMEQNVLIKKKKVYSINPEWVKQLKSFSENLYKTFVEGKNIKVIDENTTQIELKSFKELGYFLLYSLNDYFLDTSKTKELYIHLQHLYFPFSSYENRKRLKEVFLKNKTYILCKNKTIADRILAGFYKKSGKLKMGVECANNCDIFCHGNTVVEFYFPNSFRKEMDEIYSIKNILSFSIVEKLTNLTFRENRIQVVITRNKNVAERIKEQTLRYFS